MNIGIACYASVGGSGVVAAELARHLFAMGHQTHVISSDAPFRLREANGGVRFHRVDMPGYPVFLEPQYLLALANRLVQVSRACRLDIIHAHYAIPHAAAAYLAKQILAATAGGSRVPRVITTLHGTDVTILGADPSYRETVAFCIDQSDAVTAVSASLRDDTRGAMRVTSDIVVIPNFLDRTVYHRTTDSALRDRLCPRGHKLVMHVSNLRPVKQVGAVVRVFARIRQRVPARLLIVGEGPEQGRARQLIDELRIGEHVEWIGESQASPGCCRPPICSCCRRCRKASGCRRSRRWPVACRRWRRTSAGSPKSSPTASPACCTRPTMSRAWRTAPSRCSATNRCMPPWPRTRSVRRWSGSAPTASCHATPNSTNAPSTRVPPRTPAGDGVMADVDDERSRGAAPDRAGDAHSGQAAGRAAGAAAHQLVPPDLPTAALNSSNALSTGT